jgi:hypothetical protein
VSKVTVYVTGSLSDGDEHPGKPIMAAAVTSAVINKTLPTENFRDKDID